MGNVVTIAALRDRIRALEGAPRVQHERVASGCDAVDRLLGGLVRPGLVELLGPPGGGAVRLALTLAAAETARRHRVAWVDRARSVYPPTALALGVDLDRLLIVQPPAAGSEGGQHPGAWAVEQLLRSGCFPLVVITSDPHQKEPRFLGTRWRQAAERGGSTGLIVTRSPHVGRILQPDVRLLVDRGRITVGRDRQRNPGAIGPLPPWGPEVDPWSPDEG